MDKIIGKVEYEIINTIAEGGMGAVFKAKEKGVAGFEKIVAIKTLLPKLSKDAKFIDRFISEAKLVANLIHENIVQIYQLDKNKKEYYFVLEYVDGIALHDFLEYHRQMHIKIPTALAVFIAARIARGLAYAHNRYDADGKPLNIVHRDVCTHNIMINSEGVPKITDFGIAKASTISDDGTVSGKAAFMAPEQATQDSHIDFRADIYALGIVLFYMLSGYIPRRLNMSLAEVLKEARENNINWGLLSNDTPVELREILTKMLATNPDDRYSDTNDLARELEYFIYKDGYGPTIVTLADYMRKIMPDKFFRPGITPAATPGVLDPGRTVIADLSSEKYRRPMTTPAVEKTLVMNEADFAAIEKSRCINRTAEPGVELDSTDKTLVMSPEDFAAIARNNAIADSLDNHEAKDDDMVDTTIALPLDYFDKKN